jgi:hypothetical protein
MRDRLREHFDGDVAIEARIAGAVDFAHPAPAEQRNDFVRPEARTGRQSQCFSRLYGQRAGAISASERR